MNSVGDRAVLRMQLVGANPSPQVTGLDELPGKSKLNRVLRPSQEIGRRSEVDIEPVTQFVGPAAGFTTRLESSR